MNPIIIYSVITIAIIGAVSAIVLYFVAQKFKVIEDPRIDQVNELLPQANCGGCGYAGCRNFAEQIVFKESFDGLYCPVGGNDLIKSIAPIIGQEAIEKDPEVAVLRCNGSHKNAPAKLHYDGLDSCASAHTLSSGASGCPHSCLGCGDCVKACTFDAMYMEKETGLPVILEDACVACGACVKACPRQLIELRLKGKKNRRIFVSCMNTEKGGVAKKNCAVACIGCNKCQKVCTFDAITITNNLAYIDFKKCTLCRKCVEECPTNAIHEINFSPRKKKEEIVVETITEK